nr:hypothetical protein GCM10025732_06950 [Glycomyces mayteni]
MREEVLGAGPEVDLAVDRGGVDGDRGVLDPVLDARQVVGLRVEVVGEDAIARTAALTARIATTQPSAHCQAGAAAAALLVRRQVRRVAPRRDRSSSLRTSRDWTGPASTSFTQRTTTAAAMATVAPIHAAATVAGVSACHTEAASTTAIAKAPSRSAARITARRAGASTAPSRGRRA